MKPRLEYHCFSCKAVHYYVPAEGCKRCRQTPFTYLIVPGDDKVHKAPDKKPA